jgi:hypothetical protein
MEKIVEKKEKMMHNAQELMKSDSVSGPSNSGVRD